MKEICYDVSDNIYEIHKMECRFVDLGLPSGTLWGDRNLGAESGHMAGRCFSGKNRLTPYQIRLVNPKIRRDYNPEDIVSGILGKGAVTPTINQIRELLEGTYQILGDGYTCLISKTDLSKSILFPGCGKLWLKDSVDENRAYVDIAKGWRIDYVFQLRYYQVRGVISPEGLMGV